MTQLELNNADNSQILTNQVEYQIYDKNKNPLDMSICKNTEIVINYTMNEESLNSINKDIINEFKNTKINVFDINDPFFTDYCKSYNYKGDDIILEDRYYFIYQNYSFCEKNCIKTKIDIENKFITCHCGVKQEMSAEIKEPNFQYIDLDDIKSKNTDVMKCTKQIFALNNKTRNAGFILFLFIIILFFFLMGFHIYRGIQPVVDFVYEEMKKYNYLKNDDRKFFEEKNPDKTTKFKNYKNKKTIAVTNGNISGDDNNGFHRSILNKRKKPKISAAVLNVNPNKSKTSIASSERNFVSNNNFLFQTKNFLMESKFNPPQKIVKKKKKGNFFGLRIRPKANILEVAEEKDEKKKEPVEVDNFGIIKINLNESMEKYFPKESKRTLHNYTYKEATKYENRNIFQITYIFLLSKQMIFHTFLEKSPLVPFHSKVELLIFVLILDITINALLYTNSNISEKFRTSQSIFPFTMSQNIAIIIFSALISLVLIPIFIKISKTDTGIRSVFRKEEDKLKKDRKYSVDYPTKMRVFTEVEDVLRRYKIKLIIVFVIEFLLMLFCWFFVTAFCQVYSHTQGSLALNCIISIIIRFIFEAILCLLCAKLYIISARNEFPRLYKGMLFVYDFSW